MKIQAPRKVLLAKKYLGKIYICTVQRERKCSPNRYNIYCNMNEAWYHFECDKNWKVCYIIRPSYAIPPWSHCSLSYYFSLLIETFLQSDKHIPLSLSKNSVFNEHESLEAISWFCLGSSSSSCLRLFSHFQGDIFTHFLQLHTRLVRCVSVHAPKGFAFPSRRTCKSRWILFSLVQ